MKINLRFCTLLGLTAVMAQTAYAQGNADNFDIVGVRFGMTAEEAKQALLRYDPKMSIRETAKWRPTPGAPESLATLTACGHGPAALSDACGESVVVQFGQVTKKAYFIRRSVRSEAHLRQSEVAEAIFKKYNIDGTKLRSVAMHNDWFNWWAIDSAGAVKYVHLPACPPETSEGGAPSNTSPSCNISAFVNVADTLAKPGYNDRFEVAATNHRLLVQEINAQRAIAATQDKSERAKLDTDLRPALKM